MVVLRWSTRKLSMYFCRRPQESFLALKIKILVLRIMILVLVLRMKILVLRTLMAMFAVKNLIPVVRIKMWNSDFWSPNWKGTRRVRHTRLYIGYCASYPRLLNLWNTDSMSMTMSLKMQVGGAHDNVLPLLVLLGGAGYPGTAVQCWYFRRLKSNIRNNIIAWILVVSATGSLS